VAAGLVWTIGQNGMLYGLDPATGRVRQQATIGAPANHFPTPSVGDGLLLAPGADRVVAFAAPAPGARPTVTPAAPAASPAASPSASPARPAGGLARATPAMLFLAAAVIIGLGWLGSRLMRRNR
jgi:hypothetical protein